MDFLTVIVPAYNVEAWVKPCMESLLHQTMKEFQILAVDDGSTDRTGEILDRYAREDPRRITCVHQENRGLGAARNRGLSLTRTPYVTFLDSDDWMDLRFAERVKQTLDRAEEPPDILFTLPWVYDCRTCRVEPWADLPLLEAIFYPAGESRTVCARQVPELLGLEPSVNRRVFRSGFLFEIGFSFPEGLRWEDVEPHFVTLHHAQRCMALKETGFYYRVGRENQITEERGAGRLDVIPVFRNLLARAERENWEKWEISGILRMLWKFTRWSIGMADTQNGPGLLRMAHELYREIPGRALRASFRLSPPAGIPEKLGILALRSSGYRLLGDYRFRRQAQRNLERWRRKS